MLAYFKRYRLIAFAVSFGVPIIAIAIVALATGINLMSGILGGVIFLAGMLVLLAITGSYFSKRAEREAESALALYNEQCDPEGLLVDGKQIATAIYEECYAKSTTDLGAWFLSPYALACADTGAAEDAQMMEQIMLDHTPENATPLQRAGIIINVEPLTLRLHGPETALSIARDAEALLAEDSTPEAESKKSYLRFEIPMLEALIAGNGEALLSQFESVRASESSPMRLRVLDADAAGGIYASLGNIDEARKAYQFVIENGNKLPVVDEARAKLATL